MKNPFPAASVLLAIVTLFNSSVLSADSHSETKQETATDRGRYLTTILGCGGCHTEGALVGSATGPWLAGSKIGVVFVEDSRGDPSAVVFPSNLTTDQESGLGSWSKSQIMSAITLGTKHNGDRVVPVMPWTNYQLLKKQDVSDIAEYLMSLPPVRYQVPDKLTSGPLLDEPYVRISVYVFTPADRD